MKIHCEHELRRIVLRHGIPLIRDIRSWVNGDQIADKRPKRNRTRCDSSIRRAIETHIAYELPPSGFIAPSDDSHELNAIANRCRIKAQGCAWASDRIRLIDSGVDHRSEIAPRDAAIIHEGKKNQVGLWMNKPSSPIPDDPKEYDTLAGCFETMAASLDLVAVVESTDEIRGSYLRKALELLAEAQSMLRSLVLHLDGPLDSEQNAAFHWLLRRAADANIFIDRHMKKEDPADPSRWHDLLGRVHDEDQRVRSVVEASRKRRKLFSKLDFKLKQLSETDQVQNQLVSVDSTINELIESGVPPSNVELRDMILPHRKVISRLDNKSKNLELILRESRRYSDRKAKLIKLPAATSPSSEVMDAAKLLKGKSIALIGGDCRNATKQSIEDTFELKELIWVETKHGQSYQSFRSIVEQPGVAVVLLAIRWASHSFSEVNRFCKENNTPLVRLPAGYSPSQIAAQVIAQCSETLDKQKMRKESKP